MDKKKEYSDAIGIDFGSSKCCVSTWRNGQVEIIPNDQGNRLTPSYVAFNENEVLVGDKAKAQAIKNPKNTIYGFKRLIGNPLINEEIAEDKKGWPFEVLEIKNKLVYEIETKRSTKYYTPEDILLMLLEYLKKCTQSFIGAITNTSIIAVPAYYTNHQRESIINVGKKAGFKNVSVLNEPVAVAFAYGFINQKKGKNVAILDFGFDHFNLSIVNINDNDSKVLASSNDFYLSGRYIELTLTDYLVKKFKNKTSEDISNNQHCIRLLKAQYDQVKSDLFLKNKALIDIKSIYKQHDFEIAISREFYESFTNADILAETKFFKLLFSTKFFHFEVDEIVLVGESSFINLFQKTVSMFFEKKIKSHVNPREAIAIGAAVYARDFNKSVTNGNQDRSTTEPSSSKLIFKSNAENIEEIAEEIQQKVSEDIQFTQINGPDIKRENANEIIPGSIVEDKIEDTFDRPNQSPENFKETLVINNDTDHNRKISSQKTPKLKQFTLSIPISYYTTELHVEIKHSSKENTNHDSEPSVQVNIAYNDSKQSSQYLGPDQIKPLKA